MPFKDIAARNAYRVQWGQQNKERIKKSNASLHRLYKDRGVHKLVRLGLTVAESEELVIRRFQGCVLCGSSGPLHLDHIQPKSRGGTNAYGNLQWLCATCNQAKGALTPEEFIAHIKKILARVQ